MANRPTKKQISEAAATLGRKGGASRKKRLSPERMKEIAIAGAKARWKGKV
jgi:hypothetical protein